MNSITELKDVVGKINDKTHTVFIQFIDKLIKFELVNSNNSEFYCVKKLTFYNSLLRLIDNLKPKEKFGKLTIIIQNYKLKDHNNQDFVHQRMFKNKDEEKKFMNTPYSIEKKLNFEYFYYDYRIKIDPSIRLFYNIAQKKKIQVYLLPPRLFKYYKITNNSFNYPIDFLASYPTITMSTNFLINLIKFNLKIIKKVTICVIYFKSDPKMDISIFIQLNNFNWIYFCENDDKLVAQIEKLVNLDKDNLKKYIIQV